MSESWTREMSHTHRLPKTALRENHLGHHNTSTAHHAASRDSPGALTQSFTDIREQRNHVAYSASILCCFHDTSTMPVICSFYQLLEPHAPHSLVAGLYHLVASRIIQVVHLLAT